jgi:hypothetical protein
MFADDGRACAANLSNDLSSTRGARAVGPAEAAEADFTSNRCPLAKTKPSTESAAAGLSGTPRSAGRWSAAARFRRPDRSEGIEHKRQQGCDRAKQAQNVVRRLLPHQGDHDREHED